MAVLLVSAGTQGASARIVKTIEFTTALDTLTPIDVAPVGPSADDSFYVYSHAVSGDVSGHTAAPVSWRASCNRASSSARSTSSPPGGTITTRGTTDSAGTVVQLVITAADR